ncbi:MAG: carbohydrate binding family 9 domain-containing protein [Bacteroidales bacterium]|nr:carbohydrate binding family 9 domain-containing protein [Bacteroidales bacterium]
MGKSRKRGRSAGKIMLLIWFAALSLGSFSQDLWTVPKITCKIDFDGLPFEQAWEQVPPLPMLMQMPVFGNKPSEKTEIRVTYDDHYIYISGRLYDKNPSLIQTTNKKRDEYSPNSDVMGILFDNFLDRQNALAFTITPAGNRTDFTIFNDGVGSMQHMPFNMNWNTYWDVKTKITDKGWFAEIRIPISSLRFQTINGETIMGITVWRSIPHHNEVDCFPRIDPKHGNFSILKPSLSRKVVFEDLQPVRPLYIAPYTLGGLTQSHVLNNDETDYVGQSEPKITGGLDVKYVFSEKLTMDITVNPDFAQVEADDQKVNLTRFSLFFSGEKIVFSGKVQFV